MSKSIETTNDIWVFCDLRSQRLFGYSLNVLQMARQLAATTGGRAVMCLLVPEKGANLTTMQADACVLAPDAQGTCLEHGADQVILVENPLFEKPRPDIFATACSDLVKKEKPKLVLTALTDFGRELAARAAGLCRAGLIADCMDLQVAADGQVIAQCPAWGGSIVSEITYAPGWGTGFATVQPHCLPAKKADAPNGEVVHQKWEIAAPPERLRRAELRNASQEQQKLETAETVVVGGAGMGSSEGFGRIRELAAVLGGQVGATRPPVMQHWVDESRMIGQTGKQVAPRLLFSIGTSGAIQYTTGIAQADTIVAINRDPNATIFQLADIGIVADANELLPELIGHCQQVMMRQLADVLCESTVERPAGDGFGARLKKLREGRDWSLEKLAQATGQTPDFIQQAEADEISPPVGFLLRLAGAFDIDPGTFLRPEEQVAIQDQRLKAYVRRTQNYSYETLTEGRPQDHLRAFMVAIDPHDAHKPVAYKHEGEEFIFVMTGELVLTLGGKQHVLKTGEHIHFNSDIPHKLKNPSSEPTRCLVVLYTL